MKHKTLLISVITILGACQAHAASKSPVEQRYTPAYNRCLAPAEAQGQTSAVVECNAVETRIQDGRLNQAYKMVMARLPANRQEQLRRYERNWIKSRNVACAKEQRDAGVEGTLGEQIYSGCILDETIKRTIYLEQYR
jgi:uncharacterized protein YecT (DUF1311 family)